jgi:hypothetical protein
MRSGMPATVDPLVTEAGDLDGLIGLYSFMFILYVQLHHLQHLARYSISKHVEFRTPDTVIISLCRHICLDMVALIRNKYRQR